MSTDLRVKLDLTLPTVLSRLPHVDDMTRERDLNVLKELEFPILKKEGNIKNHVTSWQTWWFSY